jgi:hypothetical protein
VVPVSKWASGNHRHSRTLYLACGCFILVGSYSAGLAGVHILNLHGFSGIEFSFLRGRDSCGRKALTHGADFAG